MNSLFVPTVCGRVWNILIHLYSPWWFERCLFWWYQNYNKRNLLDYPCPLYNVWCSWIALLVKKKILQKGSGRACELIRVALCELFHSVGESLMSLCLPCHLPIVQMQSMTLFFDGGVERLLFFKVIKYLIPWSWSFVHITWRYHPNDWADSTGFRK